MRSDGAIHYSSYRDVSGCQRACAEDVLGCVAAEYQPTTGSCWLQTDDSMTSRILPAPGFVRYTMNVSCLPPIDGGMWSSPGGGSRPKYLGVWPLLFPPLPFPSPFSPPSPPPPLHLECLSVVCAFCAIAAAVPSRPQDGTVSVIVLFTVVSSCVTDCKF